MIGPGRRLRSSLGGHNAGMGMAGYSWSELHDDESYIDSQVHVRLPNEDPKKWAELSGPCITVKEGRE